jgi:hypothetical protein
MLNLKQRVTAKIDELGAKEASRFFGVSAGTISNWSTGKTSPSIGLVLADGELDPPAPVEVPDPELTMWEGKKVFILQPVYRSIHPDTHFTLFANYAKYGPERLGLIQEHRTVIYEARSILVHKFLKTDGEYVIMNDDDMILPCGNAALFNGKYKANLPESVAGQVAFSRLMSHGPDKQIVGALYFGRHDEGKAQCCLGFESASENEKLRSGHYKGLVPTDWVGTGLIRIHRSVFEKMKREIDGGRWPDIAPVGPDGGWYGFFTPFRVRMGEDVAFGRRCREIGIQSYVDAGLVCLHVGETRFGPKNTKG